MYKIETRGNCRMCTMCNAWVHNHCSSEFFSASDTCIVCCPPGNINQYRALEEPKRAKEMMDYSWTEKEIAKLLKNILIPDQINGFENLNKTNSCWLISAFQIISCLPILSNLYQYFEVGESSSIDPIVEIVNNWSGNSAEIIYCNKFKNKIGHILRPPVFSTNHQQDPSEFLIKLIDEINLLYREKYPDRDNLVEKLFYALRIKSRTCNSCFLETFYSDAPEFIINLPINCNHSIEQLIYEALAPEYIDMDCSECNNELKNHTVWSEIRYFPKVFTVFLKRYDMNPFAADESNLMEKN